MESEILNAMKEDMYLSMLIEVSVLLIVLLISAGLAWVASRKTDSPRGAN